jgi:odorant receptor
MLLKKQRKINGKTVWFRYHAIALAKMRRLLFMVTITTCSIWVFWTTLTFFGESTKRMKITESANVSLCIDDIYHPINDTCDVTIPRLMIKSYYPWNSFNGIGYYFSFCFQLYYLLYSMLQANLSDVLFCSWVLFCCEQLQHLKVKKGS